MGRERRRPNKSNWYRESTADGRLSTASGEEKGWSPNEIGGAPGHKIRAARKGRWKPADDSEAGNEYDPEEHRGNVAHEDTQRALACVLPVRVFTVTVKKGNDTRPDKQEDQTNRRYETGPPGPVQAGLQERSSSNAHWVEVLRFSREETQRPRL